MPRRRRPIFGRLFQHPLLSQTAGRASGLMRGPLERVFGPIAARLRKLGLLESVTRFVLTIGDEGATLVQLHGQTVVDAVFVGPETEDGLGLLRSYLDKDHRAGLLVAADVLEQMYRDDQLPKVGRFDRGKLLKRRLDVTFPQDRLKAGLPIGNTGKAIFASLPETEAIRLWIEFLESLPNPVTGFCLMPFESADIAGELGPAAGAGEPQVWRVLVTQQATSGFRQIFETEGRMVVTRLAQRPAAEMSPQTVAQLIERELRSSISYVKRLGYSEQDRLDLIVLAEPEVCRAVEERDLPISSLTAYTPYQAGLLLGLGEVAPEDSGLSDVLHALWLAGKKHPLLTLPTPPLRDRLLHDHIFKVGFAAAAALSLFAVADLVSLGLDAFETTTTTDVLEKQLANERQATEIIKAKLAGFDVPLDDVLLVDDTADAIARNAVDIKAMVQQVAAALGPDIFVQRAAFRVPSLVAGAAPARPAAPPPKLAVRGRPAAARSGEVLYELSLIVRFEPNPAAPHVPLEQAKALQDRLAKQFPGDAISAVRLPVNPLRSQVMEGTTGDAGRGPATVQTAEYLIQRKG